MKNIEGGTIFSRERIAGQKEAWELAKKLIASECNGGFSFSQLEEIFGTPDFFKAMNENTYLEATEKVRMWEDSKKFSIGDVIQHKADKVIGVIINYTHPCCDVLMNTGYTDSWNINYCTKTDRTLPVEDWLRQIGGQDE